MILSLFPGVQAAEIEGVRLWVAPDRTRVVLDISEPLDSNVFTMRNPNRVVIDLAGTDVREPLSLPDSGRTRVQGLRYARRGARDLRVVLDVARPVRVRQALLEPNQQYGHRLLLDLVEEQPAQPDVVARATAPAHGARDIVIAVDAGHGGEDVGAIGPTGVYEKNIALAVARELAARINRHEGMRAVLVRDGDYYVGLRNRMAIARQHKADLFVSIHADAFRDRRVRGSSVYVLSQRGASSEAARWLAENENASDLVGGVTLEDKDDVLKSVLIDLSQTASMEASIDAARDVLGALRQVGEVHRPGVQHAGFMVLKSPDIPSLLVETAFISNPGEEKRLSSAAYRQALAGAVFEGIERYFQRHVPPGTRYAERRAHTVSRGETLSAIADRYDVSLESIRDANDLRDNLVKTGVVLRIP